MTHPRSCQVQLISDRVWWSDICIVTFQPMCVSVDHRPWTSGVDSQHPQTSQSPSRWDQTGSIIIRRWGGWNNDDGSVVFVAHVFILLSGGTQLWKEKKEKKLERIQGGGICSGKKDWFGPTDFSPSVVSTGRNKYCIDKNYGGILIIWDRLFGEWSSWSWNHMIHLGGLRVCGHIWNKDK